MQSLVQRQQPTTHDEPVDTLNELLWIVRNPAFRLGFLDAQSGMPLKHDDIFKRIETETTASALERIEWKRRLVQRDAVALAQYRYEEGRLLFFWQGIRCKAWGHPDFPPAQVQRYIQERASRARSPQTTGDLNGPA